MTEDIEDRINKMEEVEELKSSFVIYSKEGIGKTTFISYLKKLLYINAEDGKSSILKTPNRPMIFNVDEPQDMVDIYLYLSANEKKYNNIVIDTHTETERMFLSDSVKQGADKDPEKDPDRPTLADYNKTAHRLSKLARSFKSLDMNKFYLCHTREDKDELTGKVETAPALMPSVMKDLNGYVDFILYMFVDDKGVRYLRTTPKPNLRAKHRIGDLPDVIELGNEVEDCNINKVLKMIRKTAGRKEVK